MLSLMERFVCSEVLLANSSPIKFLRINLDDGEVLLPASSINVGFGAKALIKKISLVNQIKVRHFYYNVKLFLKTIVEKLRERSPLKYNLTRAISSVSPTQISTLSEAIIRKRFNTLMELMVESKWVSSITADKAEAQYSGLVRNANFISEMKGFDMQSDRVDELYSKLLSRSKDFAELWFIVRQVLILSHGNACVESGFSINKSLLQENMKNESLVAQKIVFDGIQHDGGYLKVNIIQDMLRYVRNSRKAYENAEEENRKRQTEAENQKVQKKRLN